MMHYNVPKKQKEAYYAKLRAEKDSLNPESRQFIEEILYTDETYVRPLEHWEAKIREKMAGRDFWALSDLFPRAVYPALDLMMGSDGRRQFLEICERSTDYPYTDGYYRKMIRSRNYRQHFNRILRSFFYHFVTCRVMDYNVMTMLNKEFKQDVKQELADHYALEIDHQNEEVIAFIKEMLLSDNNTAILTYYVIQAVLKSKNQELLGLLSGLFLAAKLQEGVRQAVCENIDSGLQENFIAFFDLIYENNLIRFSSVRRAIATFTGIGESFADRITKKELELIYNLNHNKISADTLIHSDDNVEATLGLWKKGSEDVSEFMKAADLILESGRRHSHLAVSYYLGMLSDSVYASRIAGKIIKKYCSDDTTFEKENGLEALACYLHFLLPVNRYNLKEALEKGEIRVEDFFSDRRDAEQLFDCLERAILSMKTREKVFSPCIFPWYSVSINKHEIALNMALCVLYLRGEHTEKLTDYVKFLEWHLGDFLSLLYSEPRSRKQKDMLISLLGDRNINTRAVYEIIRSNDFAKDYTETIEGFLRLKTPAVRQAAIELLYARSEDGLKQSIENLIGQKNAQKRLGALDLLLKCKNEKRLSAGEIRAYIGKAPEVTTAEQVLIDGLLSEPVSVSNHLYDAGYVLSLPLSLTADVNLEKQFSKTTNQLYSLLKKLNSLYAEKASWEYKAGDGSDVLLGDRFVSMNKKRSYFEEDDLEDFPLADLWHQFYKKEIRDFNVLWQLHILLKYGGGTEKSNPDLTRFLQELFHQDFRALRKKLQEEPLPYCGDYYRNNQAVRIIGLLFNKEKKTRKKELIALAKTVFARIMEKYEVRELAATWEDWQKHKYYMPLFQDEPILEELMSMLDVCDNDSDFKEVFSLKYNIEKEMLVLAEKTGIPYGNTCLYLSEAAYAARLGLAEQDFFYQKVLSSNKERTRGAVSSIVSYLTSKLPDPSVRGYNPFILTPETVEWIKEHGKKLIDHIVELELKRGDTPLPYSGAIHRIDRIEGLETMIEVLKALGNLKLDRNSWYGSGGDSKQETLSHLLKVSRPLESDTAEDLRRLLKGTDISRQRLTEAAMYSPQWIPILEEYLGWKGMASGCYYFQAHTSDADKKMEGVFARYTPVSIEDLKDGAFDPDWFKEAYQDLGPENFNMLYESAKYISDGAKHSRARKFADAVLGRFTVKETEKELSEKRNKDLLAAYALIPLARNREKDLLQRYRFLQNFLKESRQFGAQRRASEAKAFRIALENLSRNAGYTDVTRLVWSMETALIDEIKKFFTPEKVEALSVYIQIDETGKSEIVYEKAGKALKSLPAKLKKNPRIEELKEAHQHLKEQYSRSVKMLEEAMEDATVFYAEEIDHLQKKNPVISPLLKNLVMKSGESLGYYRDMALHGPDGGAAALKADSPLTVAHALDLYRGGNWRGFQRDLFERQIRQPFKQVFRELYIKTGDEYGRYDSLRYAGHQIQPKKTVGVLRSRRWVADAQEGLQKVYYKNNLIARIYALADWFSPSDIEAPTLEWVQFLDRKSFKPVLIDEVPDLIFTEVMRDVDLAVSVAHAGGVDPETSHSTIEMRRAIVEFNLPLFKIKNVEFTRNHALIKGKLAEYSVHLGSGLVHQKAGAAIHVLPVHSQHRGRLFLPFVDEDPKTAEIISKVLLFANDEKIKDPFILEQITI